MSARELANSKTLYDYQMKLAGYKNRKVPDYVAMVRNSRNLLYARVLRAYENADVNSKQFAMQIAAGVNAESSPRRLFEALRKLNTLKAPTKSTAKTTMVEDLAKSKNFSNYGKKMMKYKGMKNYAKALVEAKALVAERVRGRYAQLKKAQRSEVNKYVDIDAATNKGSSPAVMFNALEEMRRFRDPANQSWRFK
jgi:hypothetical protein